MSLDATIWAYKQRTGTAPRKAVLLSMADRADEGHTCYPSIARLAFDTEMNDKTVRKAIHELEDMGFIKWTGETKGAGAKVYKLIGVEGREIGNTPPKSGSPLPNMGVPNQAVPPLPNMVAPPPKYGSDPLPNLGVKPIIKPPKEPISKSKRFVAPTFLEVKNYLVELNHHDAENYAHKWLDFYTANGWKVGKNPMKDWKASVRYWMRDYQQPKNSNSQGQNHANHQPNHSEFNTATTAGYSAKLANDLANLGYGTAQPTASDGNWIDVRSVEIVV